jgi:hypothetical protein
MAVSFYCCCKYKDKLKLIKLTGKFYYFRLMKTALLFLGLFFLVSSMRAQCEIKSRVFPDQTMYYYMDPVVFFQTGKDLLRGSLLTDKENYFLQFMPEPFPPKSENKKFKSNAIVHLSSGVTYTLDYYDFRYRRTDSTLALMFLLPKKQMNEFRVNDIVWVDLDLGDEKGARHYIFVMHKAVIREQLDCLEKN